MTSHRYGRMLRKLGKLLLSCVLLLVGGIIGAAAAGGGGVVVGLLGAGAMIKRLVAGRRKRYCTHFRKKVIVSSAERCDQFVPLAAEGVAFARKILSVDYQPSCQDCRYEKHNEYSLYGRFRKK